MAERRWTNQSQPQTLQGAVLFSYFLAAWALLFGFILGGGGSIYQLPVVLLGVAAFGIANDKKVGYWGGVVLACLNLLGSLAILVVFLSIGPIFNLLFGGVLVAMLLHPDSRAYQRTWFR